MQTIFFKRFTLILALVIVVHFALVASHLIPGQLKEALITDGTILVIFLLGILIILPGFKGSADNFALRFIGLTTLQMLSMLALIVVLIFGKVQDARYWGFTAISIFIGLLAVQSYLFVREINRKQ